LNKLAVSLHINPAGTVYYGIDQTHTENVSVLICSTDTVVCFTVTHCNAFLF